MYKALFVFMAVAMLAVNGYCGEAKQAMKEFGGIVSGVASMSAVVTAVDQNTRMVTLKDEQGNEKTFKAGPDVRNLAQVKVGDRLTVNYSETVKVLVRGESTTPAIAEGVEVSRAPLGAKPAGVITATTQASASVEAIDYVKRIATLKGPQRTVTIQVSKEEAPNFDKVKVGDTVYLEYTERLAISVTP
jgi:Cu/Ag efflux protein CusF